MANNDEEISKTTTVNLVWVCDKPTEQKYIFPGQSEQELKSDFLDKAANWAQIHPLSKINIWYDSEQLTHPGSVSNTQSVIGEAYAAHSKMILRNLRDLPLVKAYPSAFHSKLPIYFRVDLYRLVAAFHLLSNEGNGFFAYADLDIEATDCIKLIQDKENDLKEYGILMARNEHPHENGYVPYFENSFKIISNNSLLLQMFEEAIINPCIAKGQWVASLFGINSEEKSIYSPQTVVEDFESFLTKNLQSVLRVKVMVFRELEQLVYDSYWQLFMRLHQEKKHVGLKVSDEEGVLKQCQEITQDHIHFFPNLKFVLTELSPGYEHLFITIGQYSYLYVPTVNVHQPPSKFLK